MSPLLVWPSIKDSKILIGLVSVFVSNYLMWIISTSLSVTGPYFKMGVHIQWAKADDFKDPAFSTI